MIYPDTQDYSGLLEEIEEAERLRASEETVAVKVT